MMPSDPISNPVKRLGLGARLRAYFLAGLLITTPFLLTAYLAWMLVSAIDNNVLPLLPQRYNPLTYLPFAVPGIGVILAFVTLTLIGAVTAGFVGRWVVNWFEAVVVHTPLVRGIYSSIKQIVQTMAADRSQSFREVVLVEFPRAGAWSIGFVTASATPAMEQALGEEEVIGIYVATTPNPTSGYLIYVPRSQVRPIDMSVEQGFKLVISCGLVVPDADQPERK